jgi:hypothetical protein
VGGHELEPVAAGLECGVAKQRPCRPCVLTGRSPADIVHKARSNCLHPPEALVAKLGQRVSRACRRATGVSDERRVDSHEWDR